MSLSASPRASYAPVPGPSPRSYPQTGAAQAEGAQEQPAQSALFAAADKECSVFFTRGLDGNKDYSQLAQDAPELRDFLVFLQGLYNEIKTDKKNKAQEQIRNVGLNRAEIDGIFEKAERSPSLKELVDKIGDPELRTKIEQALKDDQILKDIDEFLHKTLPQKNADLLSSGKIFEILLSLSLAFLSGSIMFTMLHTPYLLAGASIGVLISLASLVGLTVVLGLLTTIAYHYSGYFLPEDLTYSLESYWQKVLENLTAQQQDGAQQVPVLSPAERQRIVSLGNTLFKMQGEFILKKGRYGEWVSGQETRNLKTLFIPQIEFLLILAEIAKAPRSQNEEGVPVAAAFP